MAAREQQDVVKEGPELAARLVDGERNGVPGARHRLEPLHHAKGGGRVEARRGLVEEEDGGPLDQLHRQREAAPVGGTSRTCRGRVPDMTSSTSEPRRRCPPLSPLRNMSPTMVSRHDSRPTSLSVSSSSARVSSALVE